jgi:predicted transcriptional regulator
MPHVKREPPLDAQITFKIPRETLARLRELALREDRTLSAQAVRMLTTYLDNVAQCEALRRQSEGRAGH